MLPSTQTFPSIDVDALARQLKIEECAREDALCGQPATDASVAAPVEMEIRQEIQRRRARALEDYKSALLLYDDRIRRTLLTTDQSAAITAEGERRLSNNSSSVLHDAGELRLAAEELRTVDIEYDDFREEHGLRRSPDMATRNAILLGKIGIGAYVLVESIVNGFFFAQGSATGLIGGFTQASVLSLLNVMLAFILGRFGLPQLYHRTTLRKLIGVFSLVSYVAASGILNLGIAHFRDLYAANEGSVSLARLLSDLQGDPFGLRDVESLILAILGMALGAASAFTAFKLDDRYPGYGTLARKRQTALQAYIAARARCVNELELGKNEAIDEMIQTIDAIKAAAFDRELAMSGRAKLHQSLADFLQHLLSVNSLLIARYRNTNRQLRTAPTPGYFSAPDEPPFEPGSPALADLGAVSDELGLKTREQLHRYVLLLNEKFQLMLEQYPTVDSVLKRED